MLVAGIIVVIVAFEPGTTAGEVALGVVMGGPLAALLIAVLRYVVG